MVLRFSNLVLHDPVNYAEWPHNRILLKQAELLVMGQETNQPLQIAETRHAFVITLGTHQELYLKNPTIVI